MISRRNWSSPFIILLLDNKNCSELRTKHARFWYKLIKFRLTNPKLRKTDTAGDTIIYFTIYRSKRPSNKNMNRRPNKIFFRTLTSNSGDTKTQQRLSGGSKFHFSNLPHATLALGSCIRWASRIASETWSQILSAKKHVSLAKI